MWKTKKRNEVIGHYDIIKTIDFWLKDYKKPLLLYGPTGIGKNLIVELTAKEHGLSLFELNASDVRSGKELEELIPKIKQEPLLSKGRLILIDEVDELRDRGGLKSVIKLIKTSKQPIVLIANNAYNYRLTELRKFCKIVKMKKVDSHLIERKLLQIAKLEGMELTFPQAKKIAERSDGDVRSAFNDLFVSVHGSSDEREKEVNIFDVLKTFFQSNDFQAALEVLKRSEKDTNELLWWVEENLWNEFRSTKHVAKALDILSQADTFPFRRRIKEMLILACMVRGEKTSSFISYKPPQRFMMLGRLRGKRNEINSVCKELAPILHCSSRKVKEQLPYVNLFKGQM